MNPVFILLVFVSGFLLWLLLSSCYKIVGYIALAFVNKAKKEMSDEEPEEINKLTYNEEKEC